MIVLLLFSLLVLVPAVVALFTTSPSGSRPILARAFSIGAPIIYCRQEVSPNPVPEAVDVYPSERGEFYYYNLINYLRVAELLDDGRVIAVARNNERLCFWGDDSQFRKARLSERLLYRWRFPRQ